MDNRNSDPYGSLSALDAASKLGSLQSVIGASALRSAAFGSAATVGSAIRETARAAMLGATSVDVRGTAAALQDTARHEAALRRLSATTEALDAASRISARYETAWGSLSATAKTFDAAWKSPAAYETAFGTTSADILGPAAAWKHTASYETIVGSLGVPAKAFDAAWKIPAACKAAHLTSISGLRIGIEDLFGDKHANALVENGWYVLLDAPEPRLRAIAELFRKDPNAANERMCELVRSHTDSIEEDVVEQFPHREVILRDAFAAHRQGMFSLSIPVLIAQTDGFWYERCGRHLFGTNIDETVETVMADHVRHGTAEQLLRSLTNEEWQLRQSRKERSAGFCALNRHQVLHGEVTDYGTEENSLKAIALLQFSSAMLPPSEK